MLAPKSTKKTDLKRIRLSVEAVDDRLVFGARQRDLVE